MALVGAVLVFAAGIPSLPGLAQSSSSARGIRLAGTLDRIPPEAIARWGADRVTPPGYWEGVVITSWAREKTGTMIMLPSSRLFFQFFVLPTAENYYGETGVLVRDLDTLQVLQAFELPPLQRGAIGNYGGGDWMHVVQDTRRLFLVAVPTPGQAVPRLVQIDLRSFAVEYRKFGMLWDNGTNTGRPANHVAGIAYDRRSDAVVAIQAVGTATVGHGATFLDRIPVDGSPGQTRRIRACIGSPASEKSQSLSQSLLFTEDHVFVPCMTPNYTILVVRLPRSSAFVEGVGAETEVAGPVYLETSLVDEAGGRIHVVTLGGEVWVFDADSMAFVGVIAITKPSTTQPTIGLGIDPATGRLFFQTADYGFGVVEGRFFPVPQPVSVAAHAPGNEQIYSDTKTGRVFVLEGATIDKVPAYKIYELDPAPVPPPPPDPDRNTADVDERPGLTESRFFAAGSGYGVRAIMAKGVVPVLPMAGAGQQSSGQVFNKYLNSKCGYTDRELVAGQVAKAEYDHGATSAEAAAATVDERTKLDFERPSRCDAYIRDSNGDRVPGVLQEVFKTYPAASQLDDGPGWGYEPASCSTSVGDERKESNGSKRPDDPELGSNQVRCGPPGEKLEAFAASELHGAISVGRTSTSVVLEKTPKGVQSTVTAVASDIVIADQLSLGEVRSTARSTSNGRPQRGNMSSHEVAIRHVKLGDIPLCTVECHPDELTERLRGMGLGRVEFRSVFGRDEALLKGTPKGAQTAVQKSAARQASDRSLTGDFRPEVPALEIVVYNDNTEYGKARQVYQFAGVATSAGYNIVLTPSGAGFADDDAPSRPDGLDDVAALVALRDDTTGGVAGDTGLSDGGDTPTALATESLPRRASRSLPQALLDGLQLIFTSPRHALLFLTAWAVLAFPATVSRRRRLLVDARAT